MSSSDQLHMRAALALARRGLGTTAPNPAVGCVLVREGRVVGRGWTQPGGRPHAETEALRRAGAEAAGATAYVTLEPCAHHGTTPPCSDALIAAGIRRCVVACIDPDRRVQGSGLRRLRDAGISVDTGLLQAEAEALNRGFILNRTATRPLVTLKLATSLDGRIALASGESRWITGPAARQRAHLLRAAHDAVLVGSGTALADNPRLDVRLPGLAARKPLRVVLDAGLRLPGSHDLIARGWEHNTLILTRPGHTEARRSSYHARGVEVTALADCGPDGRPTPKAVLAELVRREVTRLMVEGGAGAAAAFLKAGLVDHLVWFRAGKVIGSDGREAVEALDLATLAKAPQFELESVERLDGDLLESWVRKE
ncbi:bifunctional diaminohydroxyphosphoribosylaminopyrimidine deaminase/5-amino-6-(5-phosphoribosylamino)uracil reductase RibD [Aquibaculum arenosum]|uniref:Riboflavin biosynthesis protein RibD n=1 Tax=Aquibaculum arenosum TaxID=3032591 RepID=A0ABT5YK94_9PROT|nr:bifunctional diaminohydroxyphosphoribosylaminopyrimidine deaminase/5-amino-6-(5-phosphoribosylamino)uracil reductase RibD [Fodinicurvata sp. CAU 1616]MDF2095215.1 bifunctional diaminohydroxyphosphoribosylaminopyrimidine deaminase/5-amino-6-(5-phosphoribosylamino)uracil reductase RibD [Fodinicurvata sp. CAU 1616]